MDVTVITPSLPERLPLLVEAMASVAAQSLRPVTHLVEVDLAKRGPAAVRNELLAASTTEWVAFLDDDDLLDPNHLEVLARYSDGSDVVASHCRFDGPPLPPKFCNRPYARDVLRRHGIMPITFLARRSAIEAAGRFGLERYEDWELLNRMADNGCRFTVVPEVTWTYRTAHDDRRTLL